MELSDLKVFQAIAEESSISGAAKRLDYVQSNVTARLRKLEDELGVLLFHRSVKGLTITEKGLLFRKYANTILQLADESIRVLQDEDKPSGTLRIGVVETVTCGHFMNIIATFQKQYQQVTLRLETGNSEVLMEKIKNYELDAAFVTGDLSSSEFSLDYVQTDEIVLLSKEEKSIASLLQSRWAVSPKGCPFRRKLEQWYQDSKLELSEIIEISSLETLLSSVKEGITATILPKSVLTGSYEHLHVVPIPEVYRYIETGLISRKEKYVNHAYKAFATLVQERGLF
ncbi:LysR family transcriptional regulator [Bacillus horti]|uniref:DNA-binding transcriptional LysR family regulator n=1 Tax=Caldalkalibacillus horti TaxID=77523 RepID=A0ABT9VUG4_9BACI|nr:LysR family transcriptional regulator [Bacillus horti]MDQ0164632.1 DNA-binding transcriptional LysR family regulator [Bacillus horti]